MVLIKAKSIEQLKREIAEQQNKLSEQKITSDKINEQRKLERQLFELKNQKFIQAGKKAKRLSGRFGKGLLSVGKKAVPIVKKQVKLIREQQLRDDAIERKLSKKKKNTRRPKSKKKKSSGLSIFEPLDF